MVCLRKKGGFHSNCLSLPTHRLFIRDMLKEKTILPFDGNWEFGNPDLMFQILKENQENVTDNNVAEMQQTSKRLALQYEEAEALGQIKLRNSIGEERMKIDTLLKIAESGYDKYLTQHSIIKFKNKTPGCYLDDIKDFRIIYKIDEEKKFEMDSKEYKEAIQRKEAASKIKSALSAKIFDRVMVLNLDYVRYEQEQLDEQRRQREAELARDPIAFGINSLIPQYLFFIADWTDEYCNLTWETLIKKL